MVGTFYLIPSRMSMGGCLSSCSVAGTVDTMYFFFFKENISLGFTYSFSLGHHHHGREHDGSQVFAAGD